MCEGDTWCDCQHKEAEPGEVLSMEGKTLQQITVNGIPSQEGIGDLGNG